MNMGKLMNLKFNRKIQVKLNKLFYDEEFHQYSLGEVLKIAAANAILMSLIVALSCIQE